MYHNVSQILNIDNIGQKLYEDYVTERINGDFSLWAPVKKQNNRMYMSSSKKRTVKIRDQTVDLKETNNLYQVTPKAIKACNLKTTITKRLIRS